ncbi:hypothetical protein N473_03745 [Pseudoalteromonas luteoviolacea CPMOR-1]|uniref:Lipoprotein n=1 Tax=Pseudoalteromonas luteoviolacea CPMOR-1 TaxID=1365248 RepID=A0A167IEX8_9GAMM|nr:hypothetical protein [Pseudoalteromonas luteoviolacea]KZN59282.1 hypothetical protein N473_03745 [Pseudoalteromonas luteoviolacea CPMOR-1]
MKLKYNALVLAMISAIQLTGCGGGGGGSNEGTPLTETRPVQTPTTSSTPTPAPVQLAPFAVRTIQKNQCSSTAVSVDVIFHDEDGAFISSQKTNTNGQLETGIPHNARHASFVLKTTDDQNRLHTQIKTVLNVQDGFEVDALVFNDPNTCGCNDITYDLETLSAQLPNANLHNVAATHVNLNNGQSELYACVPERQKLLFTHSDTGYKGGLFDTSKPSTLTLSDEQFTALGTPLDLSNLSFKPNHFVTLTSYVGNEAVYDVTVNEAEVNQAFDEPHDKLVTFNELDTISYLSTAKFDETFTGNGFVRTHSYALSRIDSEGHTHQTQLFDNNEAYNSVYNYFEQTAASDDSMNVTFDFKSAHSRLDALVFRTTWSDFNHGNSSWYIFSDGQDVVPDIRFGAIIPSDSVSFSDFSMEIILLDLNTDQNFDDIRELYFESAESFQKRVDSELFDGMASYSLTVSEQ